MIHSIPATQERYPEILSAVMLAVSTGGKMVSFGDLVKDKRRAKQNSLAFKLYEHINNNEKYKGSDAREYCKYTFGVSILIADDREYFDYYELTLSPHSHENRLLIMEKMPVTSMMTVKQFSRYLEAIYNKFDPMGYALPKPEDIYYEAMGYKR